MREWKTLKEAPVLLGDSPEMQAVRHEAKLLASSPDPVLVVGETGTGKELVARIIHKSGPRADAAFVSFNAALLRPDLAWSALFGHFKGSFTGAVDRQPGLVEQADGGTLLLDEIGRLPQDVQSVLLRFLDEGEFRSMGARQQTTANIRLLALTNRDLNVEVENGGFQADLYYRLSVQMIALPPLRERIEDIPQLVEHFMRQLPGETEHYLTSDARALLQGYSWPGNVRELRNVIRAAVLRATREEIGAESFSRLLPNKAPGARQEIWQRPGPQIIVPLCQDGEWLSRGVALAQAEDQYFRCLIDEHRGTNLVKLAELTGLERSSFYDRLKAVGLTPKDLQRRPKTEKGAKEEENGSPEMKAVLAEEEDD